MSRRYFNIDPHGKRHRTAERKIIVYRSLQMLLVLFYAQHIKDWVVSTIVANETRWKSSTDERPLRLTEVTSNKIKKAFDVLVADKILTDEERNELVELIDYRNLIGHQIERLTSDLNARQHQRAERVVTYRADAVARLKKFEKLLSDRMAKSYILPLSLERWEFSETERSLAIEGKRLANRIERLIDRRNSEASRVNAEIQRISSKFVGGLHPHHPLHKYDDGRLTQRGEEVCYRLFDEGLSSLAVAHLMKLSIGSASRRRSSWLRIGGKQRTKPQFRSLPKRHFYELRED